MGQCLPKPVESTVVERVEHPKYRVGVAELNGWRSNMEDAHLAYMKDEWAFFGVFDGHGGDMCSKYVAKALREELEASGCPKDDAAVRKLLFDTDEAFLKTGQSSGTTAAMCIVHPGATGPRLRVINAGDSRVILGKRDGTIVDGGGTDQGLSTDHKPNEPTERARIMRCGGTVECLNGVARVNGDLAVSRGFGDADYKKTGGPGPEDRPVTIDPELKEFTCDQADFLLIVCDGVSEGDFPNPEVVKLVAEQLKLTNDDLGAASRRVCLKAVETNSKDNVSCMIVLFDQEAGRESHATEFIPGPLSSPEHKAFMTSYAAMATRGGKTLAEAVEMRYELVQELLAKAPTDQLREEAAKIGTPPDDAAERAEFFSRLGTSAGQGDDGDDQAALMQRLMQSPDALQMLQSMRTPEDGRKVKAAGLGELKDAVNSHAALKWDERMADLAGADGVVKQDDTDGTSQVRFPSLGIAAWLPTSVLTDI